LLSRLGLRVFPQRTATATSTTVREDDRLCGGERAMGTILDQQSLVSFYVRPYAATDSHDDLAGAGAPFRARIERLLDARRDAIDFVTASDLRSAASAADADSARATDHSST
jgi:hypothetical protein